MTDVSVASEDRAGRVRSLRIRLVVVLAVVAAGASVAAYALRGSPARHDLQAPNPNHNSAAETQYDVKLGVGYFFILAPLCTTGGPVKITGVSTVRQDGDMQIVDWAASPRMPQRTTDSVPGPARLPFGALATTTVSWGCSTPAGFSIGLRLKTAAATSHGFVVHSTGGDAYIPFTIKECVAHHCPAASPP